MKFAIDGNPNEIKEITLRTWNSGDGYGPDCFGEFETHFPEVHKKLPGTDIVICDKYEYEELVELWEAEVECINTKDEGMRGDYSDFDGDELILDAG